jgi:hypothetical protein
VSRRRWSSAPGVLVCLGIAFALVGAVIAAGYLLR